MQGTIHVTSHAFQWKEILGIFECIQAGANLAWFFRVELKFEGKKSELSQNLLKNTNLNFLFPGEMSLDQPPLVWPMMVHPYIKDGL